MKIKENEKIIIDHTCKENEEFRQSLKFDKFVLECLTCKKKQAKLMCKECLLPYCETCCELIHNNHLENHEITYNNEIK